MSAPPESRVFAYADGPSVSSPIHLDDDDDDDDQSVAGGGGGGADKFFDDDQSIEDEAKVNQNGAVSSPNRAREDDDDDEKGPSFIDEVPAEIMRTASLMNDFRIGRDLSDEDEDDEDEEEKGDGPSILSFEDKDDLSRSGSFNVGLVPSASSLGSGDFNSNPLFERANVVRLSVAEGKNEEDEDEELAANAIVGVVVSSPSNHNRLASADSLSPNQVKMNFDPKQYELTMDRPISASDNANGAAVYEFDDEDANGGAANGVGGHHARVFSYEDGASPSPIVISPPSQVSDENGPPGGVQRVNLHRPNASESESTLKFHTLSISKAPADQGTGTLDDEQLEELRRLRLGNSTPDPSTPAANGLDSVKSASSLQLPGSTPVHTRHRGSSASGTIITPRGSIAINRPSLGSLSPQTVHNRRVITSANLPSPQKHVRRYSHMSQGDIKDVGSNEKKEIEEFLTVTEVKTDIAFPYSMDIKTGKDSYEFVKTLPDVGETDAVIDFVEPAAGSVANVKNEEVKTVPLSDIITDHSEVPTRFSRPIRRREFHPSTQIKGLAALVQEVRRGGQHDNVQCLILFNEKSVGSLKQEVGDLIQNLHYLETIQFQEVKIKKWDKPLNLPRLLNLDARNCKIKDIEIVQQICLNSPNLYSLTISDNPICEKFIDPVTKKPALPPVNHAIWKSLLLRLPSIEYFNLIPIDHNTRLQAYLYTKSKKLYPIVATTLWNVAVNSLPSMIAMQQASGWQPNTLTELNLANMSLLTFNMMPFRHSLEVLNLQQNHISTLVGTGFHLCQRLRSVNLSHNKLGDLNELYYLGQLPHLIQLWLSDNGSAFEGYQQVAIYATRHVRGTNRTPGLQELDGVPITLDERLIAYEKHAPHPKVQGPKERWRLLLISLFGHQQVISIPHEFSKLSVVNRPDLTFCDVSLFIGLEVVNLSGNKLKTIEGLEKLTKLRVIDVRFNPELNHKILIVQLQQLGASLEWVSLSHTEEEMDDVAGIRFKFLQALVPSCPKLAVFDHRTIQVAEYVRVFTKARGYEKDNRDRLDYILNLSLVVYNTSPFNRYYDFDHCKPNIPDKSQIFYSNITILDICSLKLTDAFTLPLLPSLTLLNASNNRFSSLIPFGLARYPELLFLDLRVNKLKASPMEIASAMSLCPKLYGIALAGNPVYNAKFRTKLIGCIPELASLDCHLKLIDEPVSVEERVNAWGVASHMLNGDEEGNNAEGDVTPRPEAIDGLAADENGAAASPTPKGDHERVGSLFEQPLPDPSNARAYQNTVKFNAANKRIHELAKRTLQKEHSLHSLMPPSSPNEPASPSRTGSQGDAASPMQRSNSKLVSMPSMSGKVSKAEREAQIREQEALERGIFKFHLILQESCPPNVPNSDITELALESFALRWVDFHPFLALQKLLISRNHLTTLAFAGIETLKNLIVLDAHHNKLVDLGEVIGICNELPQLEFIAFHQNPFHVFDTVASPEKIGVEPGVTSPSGGLSPLPPSGAGSMSSELYSPEKYRLTFIGYLQQLQSPGRKLKYLDHQPVSEDEIVKGLKELGHSSLDREMFRFNSCTFGKDGMDPSCTTLDLSNRKLQRGDFTRFPHLTQLNLSKNLYDEQSLVESHLTSLQELTELDISENSVKSVKLFIKIIEHMPKLRFLRISHNPGYSKSDSERARRHFLAKFENIHMTSFKLEYLNQMKISIDERIEAMHYASQHWSALHGAPPPVPGAAASAPAAGGAAEKPTAFDFKALADKAAAGRAAVVATTSPPPGTGGEEEKKSASPDGANGSEGVVSPLSPKSQEQAAAALTAAQIIEQGGEPLNLDGDIELQMENARFILTVNELKLDRTTLKEVNLRQRGLQSLGGTTLGLASFQLLQVVDLRENHLAHLENSGIELLPEMHTLDLRSNDFVSLDSIIVSLRGCNSLQWLHIQFATKDHHETSAPQHYTPKVFADLRGLKRCDELENIHCISKDPLALSAQQLLWKVAKIGPNNMKRVDLSNKHLPMHLFYSILSPLYYLDIQELNAGGNNEWCMHPQYSDVIILMLGPKFRYLDGVEVNDARRMLAFRADKQGKESGKITGNIVVWEENYKDIHADVDEWLVQEAERKKKGIVDEERKQKERELDLRMDLPNMQRMNIQVAEGSAANTSVIANMITKVEIVIHYLQVYGMVLVMDINIPFPDAFKNWSDWVQLSTLNLKDIFHLDDTYKLDVLFAMVMMVPAIFLALYFYFDRLRGQQDDWADSYVTRWNFVKWRTFALYIILLLISTTCCFLFIDNFQTIDNFKQSKQPTPASLTWALIIFGILTVWYWVWFKFVRLFQRHWTKDQGEFKQEFKAKWLNLIHWAQIIILFAITSLYLPVARVILVQFACDTTTKTESGVYQSLVYTGQGCFPDTVTHVQYASFFFGVCYIILLPLFLIKLIREGIAIVMELNTIHENLGKEIVVLNAEINYMKKLKKEAKPNANETVSAFQARMALFDTNIKDHKKLIAKKELAQEAEYFHRINDPVRKLASTSLYAAYEYRWRFWKMIQLVQNLGLVCISLFVPQSMGDITETRVLLGCLAISACFLFVLYTRPYYDGWEDGMEILAGFANTLTVLVALGLKYNLVWLTDSRANAILLGANISAVVAFLVAIIIVPCRIWSVKKRVAKQEKLAEAKFKADNEALKKKHEQRALDEARAEQEKLRQTQSSEIELVIKS